MMNNKRGIMLALLLSFLMMATAQDSIRLRGCRPKTFNKDVPFSHVARRAGGTTPYIGDRHQLVVLVSFSDQSFTDSDPLPLWNRIFNESDFSESPFVGSVHDYFYAQSYGQFSLSFDLYYVPLSESCVKYRSTAADDENSKYLVHDIVDVLETKDIDWSQYDWDGDGYIDQLLIVYAGKGMNDGGGSNTIWPHQWWLSQHGNTTTRIVSSGGNQYVIDCYCCVQELGGGNRSSFGTICHEYSHCFGLPDFYVGSTMYVAKWDLMDYGNNNGNGYCPCNYSAHERMLMGWLTPTELTDATTITQLPALSDEPQAYLIRNDGYENEYYIVENRRQQGWDRDIPGNGIVVFHVDYDKDVWAGIDDMPNWGANKRYTIIPANNKSTTSSSSGWAYPYGDNDQLTNESSPAATLIHANTDGTKLMSKPLTNMSVTGGLASFDFMGGATGLFEQKAVGQPEILYDFGPIYIIRCMNGETKKVMKH